MGGDEPPRLADPRALGFLDEGPVGSEPREDERGRLSDASASQRGGPVTAIDEGLRSGDGVARIESRGKLTGVTVPVVMCGCGLAEQFLDATGGADVLIASRTLTSRGTRGLTAAATFAASREAVIESVTERLIGRASVSHHDFESAVESYQRALQAFLKGNPEPVLEHFSRRDDVTLANPLGPPRLGRADVQQTIEQASANFEDGYMRFEEVSRYATADLGYVVGWSEAKSGSSAAKAWLPHRCA